MQTAVLGQVWKNADLDIYWRWESAHVIHSWLVGSSVEQVYAGISEVYCPKQDNALLMVGLLMVDNSEQDTVLHVEFHMNRDDSLFNFQSAVSHCERFGVQHVLSN